MHVTRDDWVAGVQRRATQALHDWKTLVGRRLVARSGENHEIFFHDLVNADPAIIARRSNHLHELPHPLWRAPSGERECPDLLQPLAGRFFHSRESNLVQKKTSASTISTFCDLIHPAVAGLVGVKFGRLFDDDVGEARICADRRRIK